MKSLIGKFSSARGWALLLILFVGAGLVLAACGDEEVPTPTTPAPPPPTPPPAPEPEPEPPSVPNGLRISASGMDFIEWSWNAVESVSGYDVQFSTNEAFTDEDEVIARTAEEISYRRADLTAETSYFLRVRSAAGTGDGRVTSGWSTHVTGMTIADAPVVPPAPANLRVKSRGSDYIEWEWDSVAGAAGYQSEFSMNSTFADGNSQLHAGASKTERRVSNLEADSDGYLRVRSYAGTVAEPQFGEWSGGSRATTEEPPAPVTTALSAPTGLRTGSETATTITLNWTAVSDADAYEVQQLPDDGDWGPATCGSGGDDTVTAEACVASGLTRGSGYSFRVRAHPDPDDDTLTQSGWSSTAATRTSGAPPSTPITGGDDDVGITWESDDTSITWFWEAASDNRIGYVTAQLDDGDPRPACPALNAEVWSDVTYANRHRTATEADDSTPLEAGAVAGLCVRRTWMDDQRNQQYGPVALAWAAANPLATSTDPAGLIASGAKTDDRKTTAIDWYVETDSGFMYELLTVSTNIDVDSLPACSSGSVSETLEGNGNPQRHRQSNPTAYTTYAACARAKNADGGSGWTPLMEYSTRPAAPSSVRVVRNPSSSASLESGREDVGVLVTVSNSGNVPQSSANYEMRLVVRSESGASPQAPVSSTSPTQMTCDDSTTAVLTSTITTKANGFEATPLVMLRANSSATSTKNNYIFACVRAKRPRDNDFTTSSSWKVSARLTVTHKAPS